jgi:glutathione synthase/RimK-type ligase-like ATP-grasp enzyme
VKKRILIFVGEKSVSGEGFVKKMNAHSQDDYLLMRYADVVFVIKDGVVNVRSLSIHDEAINTADLVYLRGISHAPVRHALASWLMDKNIPIVNTESIRFQTISKLEQYVALALAGVPVPDSVFVGEPKHYEQAKQLLGASYPIVAKSITGSNGNDNTLVHTAKGLAELTIPSPIFQVFMPNQFDYRVIVANDHVALAYKRIRDVNTKDYKNNVAKGGVREVTSLPEELSAMAVRAARAVGREFAGLDILTSSDTGKSVVLEVNFNFGTPVFNDTTAERTYYEDLAGYMSSLTK